MEVATEFSPSVRPVDDELDPISSFNGRAQLGKQASVVRQMEAENVWHYLVTRLSVADNPEQAEDARLDLVSPDVRKELEDELALQQIILEQAMERKHRDGWKVRVSRSHGWLPQMTAGAQDADPEDVEELRVLLKKFYVEGDDPVRLDLLAERHGQSTPRSFRESRLSCKTMLIEAEGPRSA